MNNLALTKITLTEKEEKNVCIPGEISAKLRAQSPEESLITRITYITVH